MNAHDILKQKLLDTEEGHTTGITRAEVIRIAVQFGLSPQSPAANKPPCPESPHKRAVTTAAM